MVQMDTKITLSKVQRLTSRNVTAPGSLFVSEGFTMLNRVQEESIHRAIRLQPGTHAITCLIPHGSQPSRPAFPILPASDT